MQTLARRDLHQPAPSTGSDRDKKPGVVSKAGVAESGEWSGPREGTDGGSALLEPGFLHELPDATHRDLT